MNAHFRKVFIYEKLVIQISGGHEVNRKTQTYEELGNISKTIESAVQNGHVQESMYTLDHFICAKKLFEPSADVQCHLGQLVMICLRRM